MDVLQRAENKLLEAVMKEYERVTVNDELYWTVWWDSAFVPSPVSVFNSFEEELTNDQMLGKVLLLAHDHHIFFRFDDENMINVPLLEVW